MSRSRRAHSRILCALVAALTFLTMSTVAPGQTFGPPDALNSDAATDALRDDTFARIVSDGGDTFIAVWDSCGGPGTDCSTDTPFGKDRDIFFSRSTTGGVTWEPQQPLNSDAVDPKPTDSGPQDTSSHRHRREHVGRGVAQTRPGRWRRRHRVRHAVAARGGLDDGGARSVGPGRPTAMRTLPRLPRTAPADGWPCGSMAAETS